MKNNMLQKMFNVVIFSQEYASLVNGVSLVLKNGMGLLSNKDNSFERLSQDEVEAYVNELAKLSPKASTLVKMLMTHSRIYPKNVILIEFSENYEMYCSTINVENNLNEYISTIGGNFSLNLTKEEKTSRELECILFYEGVTSRGF